MTLHITCFRAPLHEWTNDTEWLQCRTTSSGEASAFVLERYETVSRAHLKASIELLRDKRYALAKASIAVRKSPKTT